MDDYTARSTKVRTPSNARGSGTIPEGIAQRTITLSAVAVAVVALWAPMTTFLYRDYDGTPTFAIQLHVDPPFCRRPYHTDFKIKTSPCGGRFCLIDDYLDYRLCNAGEYFGMIRCDRREHFAIELVAALLELVDEGRV